MYCQNKLLISITKLKVSSRIFRGGSETAATFKMELFVVIVNGFESFLFLFLPIKSANVKKSRIWQYTL